METRARDALGELARERRLGAALFQFFVLDLLRDEVADPVGVLFLALGDGRRARLVDHLLLQQHRPVGRGDGRGAAVAAAAVDDDAQLAAVFVGQEHVELGEVREVAERLEVALVAVAARRVDRRDGVRRHAEEPGVSVCKETGAAPTTAVGRGLRKPQILPRAGSNSRQ